MPGAHSMWIRENVSVSERCVQPNSVLDKGPDQTRRTLYNVFLGRDGLIFC